MRTVYASQYEVTPNPGQSAVDCFEDLKSRIRIWVENKYESTWKTAIKFPSPGPYVEPLNGHRLQVEQKKVNDVDLIILDWAHPHDRDLSVQWATTCLLARINDAVEIAILLRISSTEMILRPTKFQVGRPRFISDLLNTYSLKANGWSVPTNVESLSPSDVSPYVDNVLLMKDRTLPIVMISPDVWSGAFLGDADKIMAKLLGFSHVAKLADKWAAFRLTEELGKPFSCYDGAVRVYWPRMTLNDNPYDHFLYLPDTIRKKEANNESLEDDIFRLLCGISALRFVEGETISAVRRVLASVERAAIEDIKKKIESGTLEKSILEEDLLNALVQIDSLSSERDNLKEQITSRIKACIECRSYMVPAEVRPEQSSPVEAKPEFGSVSAALEKAKQDFTGPLLFLESADESARISVYKNPDRVYEVFLALYTVASEWTTKDGNLGQSWKQALRNLGFDVHQVSQTSGTKWKSDYDFVYKGKSLLFSEHITIGAKQSDKCCSIHWYRDDKNLVIVIGYCGEHLPNTKT